MYPYLVNQSIAGHLVRIPTFGVLLALAFSSAYFLSLRNAKSLKIPSRHIELLFLFIVFSSALGARLFHVFFEDPSYYFSQPHKILAVWEGGFTFYGSLIAAMASVILYCRWNKLPIGTIWDLSGTATILSLGIGRLGCFFAGCCWGKICHLPWGITFSHPLGFTPHKTLPLHPTQLYESLGAFLIFFFAQKNLSKSHPPGMLSMKILIGYASLRFFIEYLRDDEYRGFVIPDYLSYSQAISLLMILFALISLKRKRLF